VAGIVDRPKQWLINHLWDAQKELRVCAWALDELGEADNTIVVFTTDNGAEVFTWPDGGMTPFKASKGTIFEGGFRVPTIIRWPGHVKPNTVETGIFSGLDWVPHALCRRRQSEHHGPAPQGRDVG
jgi:hypothetical protein